MFRTKKIHGTEDEVKEQILKERCKEYLSNRPQIEQGYIMYEYIDNYKELLKLRKIKKTSKLSKEQKHRLLELEQIEFKLPLCLINEFKRYTIETDDDSIDILDKIVKRKDF